MMKRQITDSKRRSGSFTESESNETQATKTGAIADNDFNPTKINARQSREGETQSNSKSRKAPKQRLNVSKWRQSTGSSMTFASPHRTSQRSSFPAQRVVAMTTTEEYANTNTEHLFQESTDVVIQPICAVPASFAFRCSWRAVLLTNQET